MSGLIAEVFDIAPSCHESLQLMPQIELLVAGDGERGGDWPSLSSQHLANCGYHSVNDLYGFE